jgi:hypothetical protein
VASLAEVPDRVRAIFYNEEVNAAGCYLLKLYIDGVPTGVMVDDNLLFNPKTNLPVFAKPGGGHALWGSLIEKALAKVFGSYARCDNYTRNNWNCDSALSLNILTGAPAEK